MTRTGFSLAVLAAHLFSWGLAASPAEADCYPSEMGNSKENFPASISLEAVYKATGLGPSTCGMAMKKWPYRADTYVVYAEDAENYSLYVLQAKGLAFEVVARFSAALGQYQFKGFDFAPYKIRKEQTAIGILVGAGGPTKGGRFECRRTRLYEIANGGLRLILSAAISYEAEGNVVNYDPDTHFEDSRSALIIVSKPDKSGYNKIVIKVGRTKHVLGFSEGAYVTSEDPDCLGSEYCFCPYP
jgi:hypothetical protein